MSRMARSGINRLSRCRTERRLVVAGSCVSTGRVRHRRAAVATFE
jgi:hypothetical protein